MSAATPRADLMQARRDFFDRHAEPMGVVPPSILRSWRRCVERGFDSHAEPRIEPVGSAALREHHERSERLIRLCRPELEALAGEARDTGSLVILTDGGGLVLDAVGDPGFAGKAAGVALRPGVLWAEAAAGTNAIGAALVERRPTEVRGAEHYFESHRILTCAAAPILDPRGALLGALDLSGAASIPHLHALSLIRLGVDQIEHRMFAEGFEGCDVVRLHVDPALLGTPQEGVAVFEGARLVAANRHALKLLGLDWNALGARSFGDLFEGGHLGRAEERTLRDRSGTLLHARLPARATVVPGARLRPSPAPAAPAADGPVFDPATRANLARAVKLVDGDIPILIQGETGSGKEMFARAVHAASARAEKPFVAVNCAALPEGLIESELFGYEHGAFTGARRAGSKGLLREADGGVLFLDEIGDMPLPLQARLLRVVQERAVTPLGGGRPTPLDVRLICATHRDLQGLSAQQAFRPDLYFRLAQFTFALPPLRTLPDRTALIEALWRGLPTDGRRIGADGLEALRRYDWPGNHRELVGVLKAMIALSSPGETLGPDLLPATVLAASSALARPAENAEGGLEAMARGAMLSAIEACGGNVAAAARKLGVSRSTLYRRALGR
ncbi:sigma-54-dependent Fis family transcriptional regulator [Hansschlegelia beijingensis]|uniref:Transcriptional regulator of acetoin/glycerol metabolism n=1 Tax=Hansschlegelia beijingensis TaxID=1133344 RepID=A0A7W6GFH6_9HYPH|nr:sigma-54-dependent Fis family transcriptional regulator [Hansschlegelia beijingensis]MBB3973128.1 transcriptional regulator of acetoin/glycerol metabolism [Hansschlegelia beijingensis]